MRIDQVIKFLTETQEREGDIRIKDLTGFWVRTVPATGEKIVVCSVGDGEELKHRSQKQFGW